MSVYRDNEKPHCFTLYQHVAELLALSEERFAHLLAEIENTRRVVERVYEMDEDEALSVLGRATMTRDVVANGAREMEEGLRDLRRDLEWHLPR